MVEALVVGLCLLFGAETSDELQVRIEIRLVGLEHDVHENGSHAFVVYLHLLRLYSVLFVEAPDCRLYLLLQSFNEAHFFCWVWHSNGLFDDLDRPGIWSFSLQIPSHVVLPQSPLIELQLLLQLKLLNPHAAVFLQVELYLLYALPKGLLDHVVHSARDILILKEEGNDKTG